MVKKIAYSLMDEGQVPQFERDLELNMALALQDAGRFRINVFKQRGEVGMVIRAIRSVIPTIEELNLPQVLKDIIMTPVSYTHLDVYKRQTLDCWAHSARSQTG